MKMSEIMNKEEILIKVVNLISEISKKISKTQIPAKFRCPYCDATIQDIEVGFQSLDPKEIATELRDQILKIIELIKPAIVPMNQENINDFRALLNFAKEVKGILEEVKSDIRIINESETKNREEVNKILFRALIEIEKAMDKHLRR